MGGYLGEWAWVHILSRLSVCLEIGRSYVLQQKLVWVWYGMVGSCHQMVSVIIMFAL